MKASAMSSKLSFHLEFPTCFIFYPNLAGSKRVDLHVSPNTTRISTRITHTSRTIRLAPLLSLNWESWCCGPESMVELLAAVIKSTSVLTSILSTHSFTYSTKTTKGDFKFHHTVIKQKFFGSRSKNFLNLRGRVVCSCSTVHLFYMFEKSDYKSGIIKFRSKMWRLSLEIAFTQGLYKGAMCVKVTMPKLFVGTQENSKYVGIIYI